VYILRGIPRSESNYLVKTDTKAWRCRDQAGLDTLVVYTVNDEYYELDYYINSVTKANALNIQPGDYDRKIETQEDWREHLQAVEHVR